MVQEIRGLDDRNLCRDDGLPAGPFDWDEIARRTLGLHWLDRSPAEREAFTIAFACRFRRWYAGMMARENRARPFDLGTLRDEGLLAVLPTRREPERGPVTYRLRRPDPRRSDAAAGWRVYDVEVHGRGAVQRFHAEYNAVIREEGYSAVLARVCTRIREAGEPVAGPVPAPCRSEWWRWITLGW